MSEAVKMFSLKDECVFESLTLCPPPAGAEYHCVKEPKIDEFFHVDYVDYEKQLLGKSYGYYLKNDKSKLVAAFAIANSALFLDTLQSSKKNKINKEIPRVKQRRQYPALLICQLAVFDEFSSLHIGNQVMNDIKNLAILLNKTTASRFLLVEAVNEEKVLKYYENNGFDYLYSTEEIEIEKTHRPVDEEKGKLATRLMKYDMMLAR
jgi:Golgi nucleoside diphosphatase